MRKSFFVCLALALLACFGCQLAVAQVTHQAGVTTFTAPPQSSALTPDFANAKPMPLPRPNAVNDLTQAQIDALLSAPATGTPGFSPGSRGDGIAPHPEFFGTATPPADDDAAPEAYGTGGIPFTTARADLGSGGGNATNTIWPYRMAGKLYFQISGSWYICSASMIKRGVLVTAAHCVANYGKRQFYGSWQFYPGYRNGVWPYGYYTGASATVMTAYYAGTDACYQAGVICQDDIAVIKLNPSSNGSGLYPGSYTGWFGYGWNGWGFTSGNQTHITQLGYPANLNSANFMERNDSQGFKNTTLSSNTVIGSLMTGGSSGGPWVANFGTQPAIASGSTPSAWSFEIIIGVTSWGYTNTAIMEEGAAPFLSTNIVPLVTAICGSPVVAQCQ